MSRECEYIAVCLQDVQRVAKPAGRLGRGQKQGKGSLYTSEILSLPKGREGLRASESPSLPKGQNHSLQRYAPARTVASTLNQ